MVLSLRHEQFQSTSRNLSEQIKGLFWRQRWIFHSYVRNFSFHPVQAVIANQFLHSFLSSLSDVLVVALDRLCVCVWPLQESNSVILTRRHQMDGHSGMISWRNSLSLTNQFNNAEHYIRPSWMGISSSRCHGFYTKIRTNKNRGNERSDVNKLTSREIISDWEILI